MAMNSRFAFSKSCGEGVKSLGGFITCARFPNGKN